MPGFVYSGLANGLLYICFNTFYLYAIFFIAIFNIIIRHKYYPPGTHKFIDAIKTKDILNL